MNRQIKSWLNPNYIQGLVSVIIPTYNRARLLPATLNSIAAQHYRPIEIQLVDDGSTDNTRGVVDQFIAAHRHDPSLSLRCHWRQHHGASSARNVGLQKSQGEYIQFLDSDDLLHPDKLLTQTGALNQHRADFVWSATIAYRGIPDWSAQPLTGGAMPGSNGLDFIKPFIQKSCWRTESGLHRRATCANTGPWQTLAMFQDWEYHIRMLSWNPKVQFVPGNFAAANQHHHGRIGDKWLDGSGLNGALKAIQLADAQTGDHFWHDEGWQKIIATRYLEVAERADLLGLSDLARDTRQRLLNRTKPAVSTVA